MQEKVRNDWDYPDAPHPDTHTSSHDNAKAAVTAHVSDSNATQGAALEFEPTEWRARIYSENETSGEEAEVQTSFFSRARPRSRPETPETAEAIAEKKQSRKRKRQERLEEEMAWNIGLAHFSAQRNAWTAARTQLETPEQATSDHLDALNIDGDQNPKQLAVAEDATVQLPVAPRLLPNHPARARIAKNNYGEIYGKVILQGRTPTIPINLQDITNSLIHGWKEEGNWPPKQAPPEPSVGKKKSEVGSPKHPHLSRGVSVVSKVFHGLTGGPIDGSPGKKAQHG